MNKPKLADKLISREKKKFKKKTRKTFHRILACIFGSIGLFGMGYLFGMHHQLIVAMIKKEDLPKAPKGKGPFA